MIGDEFKTARKFLLENLDGSIAWKDPAQAQRQKERLRAQKEKEESLKETQQAGALSEAGGSEGEAVWEQEEGQGMHLLM